MRREAALVAAAVLILWRPVSSQVIQLIQKPAGEAGLEFGGLWVGLLDQTNLRRLDTWQWFDVRFRGAVLDQRFLGFRLGLRPQWRQTALAGLPEPTDQGARRWGLDAGVDLLPNSPLNASLSAVRSTQTLHGGFGTETRQRVNGFTGRLAYRNPYFPLELQYRARQQDEYWLAGSREWRGQLLSVGLIRFSAQNRKTGLLIERNWVRDRASYAEFTSTRGQLRHALGWGKGSRLGSQLEYLEQAGASPYELLSWTEGAHLQHTRAIGSDYRFGLTSQHVAGSRVQNRFADGSLAYQILPGLRASGAVSSKLTSYGSGRDNVWQARSQIDYRLQLFWDATLNTGASLGYERHGLEPSGDAFVTVVSEAHVVESDSRFLLNNPDVDVGSVTVTSPDRTIVYELGLDYQQVETVPSVEIVILPGGRIGVGDTVLVDYRYRSFPQFHAGAIIGSYRASFVVHGLEAYHRRTIRDLRSEGGIPQGGAGAVRTARWLGDLDEITVGVRYVGKTGAGVLELGAERSRREIEDFYRATTSQARAALTVRPLSSIRVTLGGTASTTRTEGSGILQVVAATSALAWTPTRSVQLRATFSGWQWDQDSGPSNRFTGGGVEAIWEVGLVRMDASYSRNAWQDGGRRTDDRLSLRLVRTF